MTPDIIRQVVRLYRRGHSPREITIRLRLDDEGTTGYPSIKRAVLRSGYPLRSSGEANAARARRNRLDRPRSLRKSRNSFYLPDHVHVVRWQEGAA